VTIDDYRFGSFDFGLDSAAEARAATLHEESIVIDQLFWGPANYRLFTDEMVKTIQESEERAAAGEGVALSAYELPGRRAAAGLFPDYQQAWDDSGITAGHYPMEIGTREHLLRGAAHLSVLLDGLPWLRKAVRAEDIRAAKREGGHAFFLQCQPSEDQISKDLNLLDTAYDIGLRVQQLTYNVMDHVGAGCTDRSGAGLSDYGVRVVRHLNDLGIIVDTAHCSARVTLDACEFSSKPVIATHTAAAAVHPTTEE
jgi:membrane dipeptidase